MASMTARAPASGAMVCAMTSWRRLSGRRASTLVMPSLAKRLPPVAAGRIGWPGSATVPVVGYGHVAGRRLERHAERRPPNSPSLSGRSGRPTNEHPPARAGDSAEAEPPRPRPLDATSARGRAAQASEARRYAGSVEACHPPRHTAERERSATYLWAVSANPVPHSLAREGGRHHCRSALAGRVLSIKIADYVDKMSQLWVEGQVVQFTPRGGTAFLTLRDPDVDMSLSVSVPMNAVNAMSIPLTQGARVVLQAKPTFWTKRGTLQLEAGRSARSASATCWPASRCSSGCWPPRVSSTPTASGRSPLLPHRVGLITGRNSAAEKDVVENARRRWPAVRFEIREVAVQGTSAVTEVVAALAELDAQSGVDVIVIARGGGALEELLPFSNEAMIRAVAARTPVISAIGHDVDQPLLDFVADWRASTPTDAGKKVVPDAAREVALVAGGRDRLRSAIERRIESERRGLRSSSAVPCSPTRSPMSECDATRSRVCASARACAWRPGCTGPRTRSSTCVVRSSPSRRSRPWTAATPSSSTGTDAS